VADEARILHIASAVAEGAPVDWDDAERGTSDETDRKVLKALRQLAEIADVARDPSSKRTGEDVTALRAPSKWGHLRVIDQLGRGAFGAVFRAWDGTLEREVALKLIPTSNRVVDLSRARKEARRLARVRHTNVVTIFGADFHDEHFGLWMELIPGSTLSDLLFAQGTMSAREAAAIGVDLCHALAAVHGAGLLHGDIKASNVMRQDGGRIVLMDFGAGRQIPKGDEQPRRLAGTPMYLAPEVLAGRNVSVASDIYSLGVLLFHLVTGKFPVEGQTRPELAMAHANQRRVQLRDARPDLPPAFVNVIDRALAPNPNDRCQSAGQLGAALAEVTGAQYRRDSWPVPIWKIVAASAALLAVVAGGVQGWRLMRNPPDRMSAGDARASAAQTTASAVPTAVAPLTYRVSAAFHALRNDRPVRLATGSALAPGDQMFFSLDVSLPVFVYVVNQDDKGESNLLFPLPGVEPANPVPAGSGIRLPGSRNSEQYNWVVTSAGGRDHFFVYVSPERLTDFEQLLAALPRAEVGRPVTNIPLSASAIVKLRGVGGLTTSPAQTQNAVTLSELPVLPDGEQTATGVWARRITFENPAK
jgi:eukaryotic-like serine/threonine-protein kinase